MSTFKSFEDIEAWNRSRALCNRIFELTQRSEFWKDFELKNQINASSGSVMDNISEGFERNNKKEFINFLRYSKGSYGEVRSQIYRAHDRKYISDSEKEEIILECKKISSMLSSLIIYLRKESFKSGLKFIFNLITFKSFI